MKAPAIVGMSYIIKMQKEWSNFRKENSFIRTSPQSTKGILIALGEIAANEGFFYIPNSHKSPPKSFLKKLKNENSENEIDLIPKSIPEADKGIRIPLKRGDILIYDGNLSYKMYLR